MLFKFSIFAALVAAASALQLNTPGAPPWTVGEETGVTWQTAVGDPSTFRLVLKSSDEALVDSWTLNPQANTQYRLTGVTVPKVSAGQYYVAAVSVNDLTQVYDQSGLFTINAN